MEDRREKQRVRMVLRIQIARAYTLVQSRSVIDQTRNLSIDDYRNLALEQIEGPEDDTALIVHTRRRLSDMDRLEEVRWGILSAIETLKARPGIFTDD